VRAPAPPVAALRLAVPSLPDARRGARRRRVLASPAAAVGLDGPNPLGNRLKLPERLARGYATGCLTLRGLNRVRLHVRRGPHGRGVRAAQDICRGAVFARVGGTLHEGDSWPADAPLEVFHVRKPAWGRPGCWLLLNPASVADLANLVNTSPGANNAELLLSRRGAEVRLQATRLIPQGADVFAAYGASYARALTRRPRPPPSCVGGWGRCPRCGVRFRSVAKHLSSFGACRQIQPVSERVSVRQSRRRGAYGHGALTRG